VLAAGGLIQLAIPHLKSARFKSGAVKVEGDNKIVWTRDGTHLEITQRLKIMLHPLIGLRTMAIEKRITIHPGSLAGQPFTEKSYHPNPGRVHNLHPQRVIVQDVISATWEVPHGYLQGAILQEPSRSGVIRLGQVRQEPEYEIGYTFRF
jgi:hypothetical protein